MKKCIAAAVLALASFAGQSFAAEPSHAALAKMGFGGLQRMSDAEGSQVRGKGFIALNVAVINVTTTVVNVGGPAIQFVPTQINVSQTINITKTKH